MFIFRVAVEIKELPVIRDLREAREIKVKMVHLDQVEKRYVTFVVVLKKSTHCPAMNGVGIGFSSDITMVV